MIHACCTERQRHREAAHRFQGILHFIDFIASSSTPASRRWQGVKPFTHRSVLLASVGFIHMHSHIDLHKSGLFTCARSPNPTGSLRSD